MTTEQRSAMYAAVAFAFLAGFASAATVLTILEAWRGSASWGWAIAGLLFTGVLVVIVSHAEKDAENG